jgi:hypothetical protein
MTVRYVVMALISEGRSDDLFLERLLPRLIVSVCSAEFADVVEVPAVINLRPRLGPSSVSAVVSHASKHFVLPGAKSPPRCQSCLLFPFARQRPGLSRMGTHCVPRSACHGRMSVWGSLALRRKWSRWRILRRCSKVLLVNFRPAEAADRLDKQGITSGCGER